MSQSDFVSRGQALLAQGQFQEAVKVCRLGLLGKPTTVEGRIVLGRALLALNRHDEVLAEMRVALELDKDAAAAHALRGEALLKKGDGFAAIAALQRAEALNATAGQLDRRLAGLLHEAQTASRQPDSGQAALDFVGPGDSNTKHYPSHVADNGDEISGPDVHTRQIQTKPKARGDATPSPSPSPSVLAVGDRSITVEVDPDMDGIEVADDFGEVAAPPKAGATRSAAGADVTVEVARQAIMAARANALRVKAKQDVTLVLDDDELIESDTPMPKGAAAVPTRKPLPAPMSAHASPASPASPASKDARNLVRKQVDRESGPIDLDIDIEDENEATVARTPLVPLPPLPSPRQPLASVLAQQPHVQVTARPPVNPRSAIAAALPTAAAIPMPGVIGVVPSPAAAHKTVSLNLAQQQSADALDQVLGPAEPAWPRPANAARAAGFAAADAPTRVPDQLDPRMAAFREDSVPPPAAPPQLKTGVRARARSPMAIAVWIAVGAAVIGGGVFAGFQIRSLRLNKQIAAARTRATDIAKADTYLGWLAARDSLADIVRAADTPDNRAALARADGLLAFEFGDLDARAAADAIAAAVEPLPADSLDGAIAAAYLALAHRDGKAAHVAADRALAIAAADPAALYVDGQAELATGDVKGAIATLRTAAERDPRALYFIGLAHAHAAALAWDDAIAATTRALAASPDHPGAVIASAQLQLASGRLARSATINDVRVQIQHVIDEGQKRMADQPHGVSALELGLADLALARIEFARNDPAHAREAVQAAARIGLDDQRLAEEAVDTLFAIGDLAHARDAASLALRAWPGSRRAGIALAELKIADGKPAEAIDALSLLARAGEPLPPAAQALRGQAEAATGDLDSARADFDAALQKLPGLEAALIGRAWLDLDAGQLAAARARIEAHYDAATASVAMTTVYAAILRATNDPASRDKARGLLTQVVVGPPGVDVARAQLELARIDRDSGDFAKAREAYAQAFAAGGIAPKLEAAQLHIEEGDPQGGRDMLDDLVKSAGDHPPANLLIEAVRARTLVGDNVGANALLEVADKTPGVAHWKLDRERARLALRREDVMTAAQFLKRALDDSGDDVETMLLAADAATGDDKHAELAAQLQRLVGERLTGRAEGQLVLAKLALGAGKDADAQAAYAKAADQLAREKASPRRVAQANFGLAVLAYNRKDDAAAQQLLKSVIEEDPSIYTAYLYAADMAAAKQPKVAVELLEKAVTYDPDNASAWLILGRQAQAVGNAKLFTDAIERLTVLTPTSDGLKELKKLKVR